MRSIDELTTDQLLEIGVMMLALWCAAIIILFMLFNPIR